MARCVAGSSGVDRHTDRHVSKHYRPASFGRRTIITVIAGEVINMTRKQKKKGSYWIPYW